MAAVTNRGTIRTQTTSNCSKINMKCTYTHVNNIKKAMIRFFFLDFVTINIDY